MFKRKKLKFENWKKVMVISAHPDDAEGAMGGTILKLTAKSKEVILVVATNGELGKNKGQQYPPKKLAEIRKKEQLKAAQILDVSKTIFLNYPDQGLDLNRRKLEKELKKLFLKYKTDVVFTWDYQSPHFNHPDHVVIGKTVIQTLKNSDSHPKPELYLFLPPPKEITHFIDISPTSFAYQAKIKALKTHFSQFTPSMLEALQKLVVENSTKKGHCTENFKKVEC